MSTMTPWRRHALRVIALLLLSLLALQMAFLLRIALMLVLDPQSTTFQRSEMARVLGDKGGISWSQQWVDSERIAATLKRAVIASEDAGFVEHSGIEWDAIEQAWDKNQRAQARAQRQVQVKKPASAKVVGASTISQQLAKNLLLSGERTVLRKAQEMVLTLMMEALLSKERVLTIYLNNVEWGEGIFGAQAAAQHYFRVDASKLGPEQAARLAVMLPAPKRFERQFHSAYLLSRVATIVARMPAVDLP